VNAFQDLALNFVANALWQVALVVAVAAPADWFLRHRVPARQRHLLWVTALLLSVLLPCWSALPLEREPFRLTILQSPISSLSVETLVSPSASQTPTPATDSPSSWRQLPFGQIIVGLYLLFLLDRLHKLWRAWRLTSAIWQSALPVTSSEILQSALAHCRARLSVGEVVLFQSPSVTVPVTLGLRKPAIILPKPLLTETSTDLLHAALGHELTHIQRRDFAWNLLYEFLFLFISFHPAARRMKRRINETRELACDEVVSASLMEAQPYANALVKLARAASFPPHSTYSLSVNDADILEERVMKLLANQPSANSRRATALLSLALVVLALAGAGAAALPLNLRAEQPASNQTNIAVRFVGHWQGVVENNPNERNHELIFKLEGDKLVGSMRIADGEFKPLPSLKVSARDVSWKEKDPRRPKLVLVTQVRLISEDEILFEAINPFDYYGEETVLEVHPTTWTLKRQK